MQNSKPNVVKDYMKLPASIKEKLFEVYPYGFDKHLISFFSPFGKLISVLPLETEDCKYMVRMTRKQAMKIVLERRSMYKQTA
jgi:hypothetical protein